MQTVQGGFDGLKVFSATKAQDRDKLGETVTDWLDRFKGKVLVTETVITQSSDSEFHCLAITVFFKRV